MNIIVKKTKMIRGSATPPSSKSHTVRALVLALIANGASVIANPLKSEDSRDAVRALKSLGAQVTVGARTITVRSKGLPIRGMSRAVFTGNSGIATRFLLPILGFRANAELPLLYDCGRQMRARPIKPLAEALNALGMSVKLTRGSYPLKVSGTLLGGKVEVAGLTSQYLSALLLSLPLAPRDSELVVRDLHERPYAQMTEYWMKKGGIRYAHTRVGKKDIYRIPGGQRYQPFKVVIPGDFSSASYIIAAAVLLEGDVAISGLDMKDSQGDKALIPILKRMGASIVVGRSGIRVRGGKKLKGIVIDANAVPDLVPTLAVVATQARGKTDIVNVTQARIKETDRLRSMAEGLLRLGARVVERKDGLTVYRSALRGARVRGFGDHRTVMALSVAGLIAEGVTTIEGGETVRKTFPGFVPLMRGLGARLTVL